MADRHSRLLFESSLVQVVDVACRAPRSGCGDEEWSGATHVVVPRRGVFTVHRSGEPMVAEASTAIVFAAGGEYRVSHPVDGGDECAVLVSTPELMEEALGNSAWRRATIRAATQLATRLFTRALAEGKPDPLEAEEAGLLLLGALAADLAPPARSSGRRVARAQRRRVEEVRALLAAQPTARWSLDTVARAVHCSPFHLARQFREVTGETVSRYLLRLRLAVALDRLAEGERRLARLALDLGFAHHSHFSARFRSVFGITPAAARETLTRSRVREVSTIVTAAQRPTP